MKQNENEIKGKELFELSLTFTEGDEEKQFSVTMKAKKDGKETSLDLFDSDFLEMSYNGVKMVFSQITYLYVKNLHDTGRMSDEEYNAIMAQAGQKPQGKAKKVESNRSYRKWYDAGCVLPSIIPFSNILLRYV